MSSTSDSENHTVKVLEKLKATGSRDAIVAGNRRISGTEALGMVLRFAATLRKLELKEGDGVALFVENSPEALLLTQAIHFVGCRLVFVPPEPGNSELETFLQRAGVKALLFDPVFDERTRRITQQLDIPHVFSVGTSSIATDFLATAPESTDLMPHEAADGRHLAMLLYTGATTGVPKLVTHRNSYYDSVLNSSESFVDETSQDPKTLICTLLTHTSGHVGFLIGILSGHTVVLLRKFSARAALSAMESEGITQVILVPPMLYELLDHPDYLTHSFPEVRTIFYTGAPAAPARIRQAIERFGPVLHQIYGASEDGLVSALAPEEHDLTHPETLTSCGRPVPGVEVELRDGEGNAVPTGEAGELYVRSRTVMEGYWGGPGAYGRSAGRRRLVPQR
jgi:fatty-acyl-CoA synthase